MKLPFKKVTCPKCNIERMQNELIPIRPYNENRYVCPTCKTEIKIITE